MTQLAKEVSIELPQEEVILQGTLTIPDKAKGLVVFAHGSGSGRFSPRNQMVARVLVNESLGTLLLDLLTREEEEVDEVTREFRFDIPLLARRLIGVAQWLGQRTDTSALKINYFGSSTGAAAALIAAAAQPGRITSVVSRGGRADLANDALERIQSPTLLIVGGNDFGVIELNQDAFERIPCEKKLIIIPGATHLFAEPGTLEQVARAAADWFLAH